MKKVLLIALAAFLAGGLLFATDTSNNYRREVYAQDARMMALGNAFTAVVDDGNALFYNPAGLAYLRYSDFILGTSFLMEFTPEGMDKLLEEEEIPIEDVLDRFTFIPRAIYAERGWAVGALIDRHLYPISFDEESGNFVMEVEQKLGLAAGMGINLGPLAVGGNVRLFKDHKTTLAENTLGMTDSDFFSLLLFEGFSDTLEAENKIEVGAGALVTLGSLSAGIYIDKLLDILEGADGDGYEGVLGSALQTANVGVAFEPFSQKTARRRGLLNIMLAADLKNLGDDDMRVFSAGTEVGLRLGNAITASARLGYSQPLPGELADAFSGYNPDDGEIAFGIGAKALALDLNFAMTMPAQLLIDPPDEEVQFGAYPYGPRFMVSGGLRF